MRETCCIPRCRREIDLVYLDHGLCAHHWDDLTAADQPAGALARALGISVTETATPEDSMTETAIQNATPPETKTTKTKAPKKAAKTKAAAPKTKPPKVAKPKREKPPKEDLMTFAFRMPKTESAALHAAAGPANASRTMRALATAFVAGDREAFEAVVADAKKLQ